MEARKTDENKRENNPRSVFVSFVLLLLSFIRDFSVRKQTDFASKCLIVQFRTDVVRGCEHQHTSVTSCLTLKGQFTCK